MKYSYHIFYVVDIQEVPSEMPIYLLAEDEGNEEEILRLLESESPGGSPYLPHSNPLSLSEPQTVTCTTELKNQYSINSLSLHQEAAISKGKSSGYVSYGNMQYDVVKPLLQ